MTKLTHFFVFVDIQVLTRSFRAPKFLYSRLRGRNGFNNNPNIQQFKKILLRASISVSKYSNCLSFEDDASPPIFSLKWTKNCSSLSESSVLTEEDNDMNTMIDVPPTSEFKDNALAYIGGFILRKKFKNF